MENASKALIMAGEILLGIMIISIGVYIFNEFNNYTNATNERIKAAQINQFNTQFTKYTGARRNQAGVIEPVKVDIHEIVSLANLAKKNNLNYNLDSSDYDPNGGTYYIRIDIENKKNIENYNEDQIIDLIKNNSLDITGVNVKYYTCDAITNCYISNITGRVYYMKFEELP